MTEAEDLGLGLSRLLCKVGLHAKPAERGALAGPEGGTLTTPYSCTGTCPPCPPGSRGWQGGQGWGGTHRPVHTVQRPHGLSPQSRALLFGRLFWGEALPHLSWVE